MRGGQYQVLLLLDGLRERGHHSVLLARKGAPLWRAAVSAGHRVASASPVTVWNWSGRFDIVHAHDARAHTMAALASRKRFVVSRRVAFPVKKTFSSHWKYGRAAGFLAVSEYVAAELRKAHVPAQRIHIVHDGVAATTTADNWDSSYPIVALQTPDPGKLGPLVKKAAELAGVEVQFSTDLPAAFRHASAFLYLSDSEGLGSGALLAMSMGVPVIASEVGGLAEAFVHGSSGLYVRNDAEEIASAIRMLLGNRALALRLRTGGMERVRERFSAEKMISDTLVAYERALG